MSILLGRRLPKSSNNSKTGQYSKYFLPRIALLYCDLYDWITSFTRFSASSSVLPSIIYPEKAICLSSSAILTSRSDLVFRKSKSTSFHSVSDSSSIGRIRRVIFWWRSSSFNERSLRWLSIWVHLSRSFFHFSPALFIFCFFERISFISSSCFFSSLSWFFSPGKWVLFWFSSLEDFLLNNQKPVLFTSTGDSFDLISDSSSISLENEASRSPIVVRSSSSFTVTSFRYIRHASSSESRYWLISPLTFITEERSAIQLLVSSRCVSPESNSFSSVPGLSVTFINQPSGISNLQLTSGKERSLRSTSSDITPE